ncbi:hypothetical protein PG994_012834 [Apiospora phragmitis]|uniref:Uncharacterized protein n=1 Tax=Apiospora phragmitis TaxID=2905665 RepID=A0ABR1T8K5_9PEZI
MSSFTQSSISRHGELALAILPLCIGAIKGIAVARKRLKVLKHHDSETKRLQKKFRAQSDVFLDEKQLPLQDVEYMGRKYEDFQETVSELRDGTMALNEKLNVGMEDVSNPEVKVCQPYLTIAAMVRQIKRLISQRPQIKASERMQQAVHFTMKKSRYQTILEELKEAVQELKRLRKAAAKIQHCPSKSRLKRVWPLPESFQQVAQHSRSFYDALRSFWSCFHAQHTSHDLRLLLDSRKDGSLPSHCALPDTERVWNSRVGDFELFGPSSLTVLADVVYSGLLDLFVRSQSLRLVHITIPSTTATTTAAYCTGGEERTSKARRVRFSDDCVSSIAVMDKVEDTLAPPPIDDTSPKELDLCSSGDMCTQLCAQTSRCGGYLDTPEHLRHHLYPVCGESCDHTQCFNPKRLGEPALLDEIFKLPVERSISVPAQLRLALSLVKGVLQFQSTPWLQPLWRLHVSGVALLQIGQWGALKPEDIVEVRRIADLSARDSRLGPKFQKLTQQCLDCDFGFGKDLNQPELQSAIYRDVVCELEGLIQTLEGRPSDSALAS